jgi:hypothetical protein
MRLGERLAVVVFVACALAWCTPQRLFAQATPAPAPGAATAVPVELPRPEYPESLRSAGVAGKVVVHVTIGADGRVQDVNPIDGPKMLWAAVVPAAGQAIFQCHDCREGLARYVVVYEFKLRTKAPSEAAQPPPVFNATQARVIVVGQGRRVISNDVPREEVRAVRCLWLWHCGLRPRD